jgi:outer membrane protein
VRVHLWAQMRYPTGLLLLAACVLAPRVTIAQVLPLQNAVDEALTHNRSLQAARAAVHEAGAAADAARSDFFPTISFTESWQRGNQPVFVFGSLLSSRQFAAFNFAVDALNHPDPLGLFHGAIGVEQTLFDGGHMQAARRSALLRRDIAQAGADEASGGIALAVTQAYGRLVTAQSARRAADAAVASAHEDRQRAERRRDAGMATDADVLAMTVHEADMRQRSLQAAADAAVATAELNRLMGSPIEQTFEAEEPAEREVSADSSSVAALLAEADAARPEVKRAAAAVRLAEAGRADARAGWYPHISAQAGYELNGTRFADRASAWVVGGELTWTLATGGAEGARIAAAVEAGNRARAEADEARAAVHVEVISALRRLEAARARETVGRSAVDEARETQRIVRDRYESGLASINDVLRTSSTLLDAELQRTAAVVDSAVSAAMLRHALGRVP